MDSVDRTPFADAVETTLAVVWEADTLYGAVAMKDSWMPVQRQVDRYLGWRERLHDSANRG